MSNPQETVSINPISTSVITQESGLTDAKSKPTHLFLQTPDMLTLATIDLLVAARKPTVPVHDDYAPQLLLEVNMDPDIRSAIGHLRDQRSSAFDKRAIYIQLLSKQSIRASEDVLVELQERARNFLGSKSEVLLILGDSGAGKTTFGMCLESELWSEYKPGGPIPLFIDLKSIDAPDKDMIHQHLDNSGFFTDQQIDVMLKSQQFVLICDGYDEYHKWTNLHTKNHFNRPRQWQAKMIISCRTQYLGPTYRYYFEPETATINNPNLSHTSDLFEEAVIVPFRTSQIREYVELFTQIPESVGYFDKESRWTTEQYMEGLKKITNMMELAKNPFMLKMILDVLPRIAKTTTKMSRVDLYDNFVRLHFESEQQRLMRQQQSNGNTDNATLLAFASLEREDLIDHGLDFSKQLSRCIFREQGGVNSVTYSDFQDGRSWKNAFFGNDPRSKLLRQSAQLVCRENSQNSIRLIRHRTRQPYKRNTYEFSHRSMLEYYYSCLIYDPRGNTPPLDLAQCLESSDSLSPIISHPLGQTDIVSEYSIVHFLVERVQHNEVFYNQLQKILQLSKVETAIGLAAANAITILIRAGVRFNGDDLRGIQIPGADLSDGYFDSAQLQGAYLNNVRLKRTWLRQADLTGATMTNVWFGEKPFFKINRFWSSAISRDGKILAAGLGSGNVQVYDVSELRLCHTFQGHSDFVAWVAISNDSSLVASGSWDKTVRIWKLDGGEVCMFEGHSDKVSTVAFAPDGRHVASTSIDGTARIWNIGSKSCVRTFPIGVYTYSVPETSLAWSPCGRQIVSESGSGSGSLILWNVETGEPERSFDLDTYSVKSIVYSCKGKLLALGRAGKIFIWDLSSEDKGTKPFIIRCTDRSKRAVLSEDEQTLAVACDDGSIQLWDVLSGSLIDSLNGHYTLAISVAFLKDQELVSASRDGTVRFWQLKDELDMRGNTFNSTRPCNQTRYMAHRLAYSPKGDAIFTVTGDHWIGQWNIKTGDYNRFLEVLSELVPKITISPDGRQLATANGDLKVYQLCSTDKPKADPHFESKAGVAAYSPCERWMASGDDKGIVRLWNLRSREDARVLKGHLDGIRLVKFSPDGCRLVSSCTQSAIRLWDTESAECLEVLEVEGNDVSFSPCGRMLTILKGFAIHIWHIEEKRKVVSLREDNSSSSVAWSPCGRWIAIGYFNASVKLWEVSNEGQGIVVSDVMVIRDFEAPVHYLAWSPTDPLEVATFSAGTICVWRVIEIQGKLNFQLVWNSMSGRLTTAGAKLDQVIGLTEEQQLLLMQRRAVDNLED